MKAAVMEAVRKPLVVKEVADPKCPANGVIVRTEAEGVCRSDWHAWSGDWAWIGLTPPMPLFAIDDDVAEIDADAELHPPLRRQVRVLSFERSLNLNPALNSVDHAGELGQDAVSRRVYEAAVMLFD